MKNRFYRYIAMAGVAAASTLSATQASAQYSAIVNQLPNLIQPALSGSMRYRGFVDLTGTLGVGNDRANFVGISTTQGFQYSNWFFMGAGIGIDVAMSSTTDAATASHPTPPGMPRMSRTKAMVPVFSDFRFNIGGQTGPSMFIDIKAGAAWLLGNGYLELNNGALSNRAQFILRPSVGVRIPTNQANPKNALNIGLTYQLITADNSWSYWGNNYGPTISSLGLSIGYEW